MAQESQTDMADNLGNTSAMNRFLPDTAAGLANGLLIIIFQSAYAALIFSGDLAPFLSRGLGFMLAGALVMGLTVALTSSYQGNVTAPQDAPTAIMAVVAASTVAAMSTSYPDTAIFGTVVVAMCMTAFLTGIFLLTLGWFQLGNLIRFIPFPVVGGFLAGTGWILLTGGLSVTNNLPLQLDSLVLLLHTENLIRWLPALMFAIVMQIVQRRTHHPGALPATIVCGVAFFYVALAIFGIDVEEARHNGWLLTGIPEGIGWQPLSVPELSQVSVAAIAEQAGNLITITIICVISLLLNASGMELIARQELDLNKELRSSGLANILGGLVGSSTGYISLSLTNLAYKIGARERLSSIISASLCGIVLILGANLSSYIPRPLLGGLLLYLALTFLIDWIYYAARELPRMEYALVIMIMLTIGIFGFLQGMVLGILIAVVLFVVNYSRIDVIKHVLSGLYYRSNVERGVRSRKILKQRGDSVLILQLQGFIFFGTANTVYRHVRQRLLEATDKGTRYIVLDFHLVNGLDASALHSFAKMKMMTEKFEVSLVFCSLQPQLLEKFVAGGIMGEGSGISYVSDLDHAMEQVESQILLDAGYVDGSKTTDMADDEFLARVLQGSIHQENENSSPFLALAQRMMIYMKHLEFQKEDRLIREGDQPTGMYLIKSGRVTVRLRSESGKEVRLRSLGPGTIVGEMGIYLKRPTTASVVVDEECVAMHLTTSALEEMEENDADLAAAFHKFIVRILGERVTNSNRTISALMR